MDKKYYSTSHLSFKYHGIYYTNTIQIKLREFIGHIKQQFITSPLTYVTNGIQDFVKYYLVGLQPKRQWFLGHIIHS